LLVFVFYRFWNCKSDNFISRTLSVVFFKALASYVADVYSLGDS